jgi:hypothetical protein
MRRLPTPLRWLLGAALGAALAGAAAAYIPEPGRVVQAVAETNRASGRAQALKLELVLRIADGEPRATGELVTHPTGLARLELRGAGGLVERQILTGSELRAARNGRPVDDPRAFLPPLFLLQTDDGLALEAALAAFGVDSDAIALAPCGQHDCYVVGGRAPMGTRPAVGAGGPAAPAAEPDAEATDEEPTPGAPPSLWVDVDSHEVAAIVERGGVRVRLGPTAAFAKVRLPQWLLIEEPGRPAARLEVRSVTPVNAPAAAFGEDWLLAPPPPP